MKQASARPKPTQAEIDAAAKRFRDELRQAMVALHERLPDIDMEFFGIMVNSALMEFSAGTDGQSGWDEYPMETLKRFGWIAANAMAMEVLIAAGHGVVKAEDMLGIARGMVLKQAEHIDVEVAGRRAPRSPTVH